MVWKGNTDFNVFNLITSYPDRQVCVVTPHLGSQVSLENVFYKRFFRLFSDRYKLLITTNLDSGNGRQNPKDNVKRKYL